MKPVRVLFSVANVFVPTRMHTSSTMSSLDEEEKKSVCLFVPMLIQKSIYCACWLGLVDHQLQQQHRQSVGENGETTAAATNSSRRSRELGGTNNCWWREFRWKTVYTPDNICSGLSDPDVPLCLANC